MVKIVRRALYVGRFQPFHLGHLIAIRRILADVGELVIVIGSAQYSHNATNPFTAGERLVMIRKTLAAECIDNSCVWIVPVPDVHFHMMWVAAIEGYTPRFDVVYTNEPLTRRLFLEAGYQVEAIHFFDRKLYSSTQIRERMLKDESWMSLVPKSVAAFIKEIDGINRLRDLTKSDKA